jgi:hypothetical protein
MWLLGAPPKAGTMHSAETSTAVVDNAVAALHSATPQGPRNSPSTDTFTPSHRILTNAGELSPPQECSLEASINENSHCTLQQSSSGHVCKPARCVHFVVSFACRGRHDAACGTDLEAWQLNAEQARYQRCVDYFVNEYEKYDAHMKKLHRIQMASAMGASRGARISPLSVLPSQRRHRHVNTRA